MMPLSWSENDDPRQFVGMPENTGFMGGVAGISEETQAPAPRRDINLAIGIPRLGGVKCLIIGVPPQEFPGKIGWVQVRGVVVSGRGPPLSV